MQFKRKIFGMTDYRKRLELLKGGKLRLVVRKSLRNILAQIVEYKENGDIVKLSASTRELIKKYNLKIPRDNLPSSYLLGFLLGTKALKKGIKFVILDSGMYRGVKGSRIYGVIKGALDSGLKIPHNKDVLPNDNRVYGEHIIDYYKKGKKFSGYKIDVELLGKHLDEIKEKILKL